MLHAVFGEGPRWRGAKEAGQGVADGGGLGLEG
jgi:hypothetical protein